MDCERLRCRPPSSAEPLPHRLHQHQSQLMLFPNLCSKVMLLPASLSPLLQLAAEWTHTDLDQSPLGPLGVIQTPSVQQEFAPIALGPTPAVHRCCLEVEDLLAILHLRDKTASITSTSGRSRTTPTMLGAMRSPMDTGLVRLQEEAAPSALEMAAVTILATTPGVASVLHRQRMLLGAAPAPAKRHPLPWQAALQVASNLPHLLLLMVAMHTLVVSAVRELHLHSLVETQPEVVHLLLKHPHREVATFLLAFLGQMQMQGMVEEKLPESDLLCLCHDQTPAISDHLAGTLELLPHMVPTAAAVPLHPMGVVAYRVVHTVPTRRTDPPTRMHVAPIKTVATS